MELDAESFSKAYLEKGAIHFNAHPTKLDASILPKLIDAISDAVEKEKTEIELEKAIKEITEETFINTVKKEFEKPYVIVKNSSIKKFLEYFN